MIKIIDNRESSLKEKGDIFKLADGDIYKADTLSDYEVTIKYENMSIVTATDNMRVKALKLFQISKITYLIIIYDVWGDEAKSEKYKTECSNLISLSDLNNVIVEITGSETTINFKVKGENN